MAWFNRKRYGFIRIHANNLVGKGYDRTTAFKMAWARERKLAKLKIKRDYGMGY